MSFEHHIHAAIDTTEHSDASAEFTSLDSTSTRIRDISTNKSASLLIEQARAVLDLLAKPFTQQARSNNEARTVATLLRGVIDHIAIAQCLSTDDEVIDVCKIRSRLIQARAMLDLLVQQIEDDESHEVRSIIGGEPDTFVNSIYGVMEQLESVFVLVVD